MMSRMTIMTWNFSRPDLDWMCSFFLILSATVAESSVILLQSTCFILPMTVMFRYLWPYWYKGEFWILHFIMVNLTLMYPLWWAIWRSSKVPPIAVAAILPACIVRIVETTSTDNFPGQLFCHLILLRSTFMVRYPAAQPAAPPTASCFGGGAFLTI